MTSNEIYKENIWKYYLASSLALFAFYIPIMQLFYLGNNLTILKIAFLGVVFGIAKLVLEIPSSILADKWGRKKTIVLSSVFAVLQIAILIYSNSYYFFIVASIMSAASYAFLSGTDIAFFYDNLKLLKKEKEFDRLWARKEIYNQVPLLISFISSGILFKISPVLPFQLALIFLILSLIVNLTLKEPKYHKPIKNSSIFIHIKESINYIRENSSLKHMLIFTVIFCIGSDLSYYYGQIYLKLLALPIIFFGIIYTLKSLVVTFSTNVMPPLLRKYAYKDIFLFEIIMITVLLYIMVITKNAWVGAICFILIAVPYGFFLISKSTYIHHSIQSHQRATIDSIFSFSVALAIVIIEPIVGYLADLYSIKLPFLLIAILLSFYCCYYLIYVRKNIDIIVKHN